MTLQEINKHVEAFHSTLLGVVKGLLYKANKAHIDPSVVINEAYLHLVKNQTQMMNNNNVERLLVNFCKQNILWSNSQINKQERNMSNQDLITEIYLANESDREDYKYKSLELEDDIDTDNKIEIEKWYTQRQFILQEYYDQLKDPVLKRIYEVYWVLGYRKGKDFSLYFKSTRINKDTSAKYIRMLKADIKHFYEENYVNNCDITLSGCGCTLK